MSDSAGTAAAARGDDDRGRLRGLSGSRPIERSGPGGSALVGRRAAGGPGLLRSIAVFYRQVVAELRKVIWPTRRELITYTTVVLAFVVVMVLIVSAFDFAFSQAVLKIFGGDPASTG